MADDAEPVADATVSLEPLLPGEVVRDVSGRIGGPDELVLTLENLPVGADCTVTETSTGGADRTTISVTGAGEAGFVTVVEGTTAQVTLDSQAPVAVLITNTYYPDLAATGGWGGALGILLLAGLGIGGAGGILLLVRRRRAQRV